MRIKIILFILFFTLLANGVFAETRFYLSASGSPEGLTTGYPTWDAGWMVSSEVKRVRCTILKANTVMTTETSPATGTASYLFRQYVSDPLSSDYTFPGNVRGQILGACPSASKSKTAVAIKVVSGDGVTVKGTLLPFTFDATTAGEFPTTLTNRAIPFQTNITSITALKGDRVVIEVGYYSGNPSAKSTSMRFGDDGITDLPEDTTTTTQTLNPWIEFGRDIPIRNSSMIIE
jgi:hypothetical protein